jgi:hypothetical protein
MEENRSRLVTGVGLKDLLTRPSHRFRMSEAVPGWLEEYLTRMRQKDDADSVRNVFQTPAAIGSQHPNAFSEHYTTQPASRRSFYELPRAS